MKQVSIILCFIITLFSLKAQNYVKITGIIISKENNQTIPFAHIGLLVQNIGTISNEQGEFIFKYLEVNSQKDSLQISAIGFITKKIPLGNLSKNTSINFKLETDITYLEEITVSEESAFSIVSKAIQKIPENYDLGRIGYEAFARQKTFLDGTKITLFESVISSFLHKRKLPKFKVLKLRAKSYNKLGNEWLKKERLSGFAALQVFNIQFPAKYLTLGGFQKSL